MGLSENGPYGHLNVEKMMINQQNWGVPCFQTNPHGCTALVSNTKRPPQC
jgi:hypothetical protein